MRDYRQTNDTSNGQKGTKETTMGTNTNQAQETFLVDGFRRRRKALDLLGATRAERLQTLTRELDAIRDGIAARERLNRVLELRNLQVGYDLERHEPIIGTGDAIDVDDAPTAARVLAYVESDEAIDKAIRARR